MNKTEGGRWNRRRRVAEWKNRLQLKRKKKQGKTKIMRLSATGVFLLALICFQAVSAVSLRKSASTTSVAIERLRLVRFTLLSSLPLHVRGVSWLENRFRNETDYIFFIYRSARLLRLLTRSFPQWSSTWPPVERLTTWFCWFRRLWTMWRLAAMLWAVNMALKNKIWKI